MSKLLVTSDKSFKKDILYSKNIVFLDFWAKWCGPCLSMIPIIEDLSSKYENKVYFYKIDIDENPITSSKYEIRSVPTFIVFKDGKILDTKIGSLLKTQIISIIEKFL